MTSWASRSFRNGIRTWPQNKITTYAWYQKQILQAVKVGVGYAKKEDDLKLVLA